jgi:signal peptidase
MPRHRPADPDPEDLPEEEVDSGEEAPPARRSRRRSPREPAVPPMRNWSSSEEDEEPATDWRGRPKKPVYWRARDSLWFEPLIAVAIVVLLIVGLWAYTQNWPPIYVVESMSMQHGDTDQLGLINTGDLVLAQKIDPNRIQPYVAGMQSGYTTYGEYGDVVLYYPLGDTSQTPIIHRAIIYLQYNGNHSWSAPSLSALPCSTSTQLDYTVDYGGVAHCGSGFMPDSATVTLYGIGWQAVDVVIPLGPLVHASGFLTMGDNNINGNEGEPDQFFVLSEPELVQPSWVVGVARGMIPWVGAIKLLLEGQASMVPPQSWDGLGLTLAGLVLAGLGLHLFFRRREQRRGDTGDEDPGEGPEHEPSDEPDSEEGAAAIRPRKGRTLPKHKLLPRQRGGGRPRPSVRSDAHRSARAKDDSADDPDL